MIGWRVRNQLREDAYNLGYRSVYDYLEDISKLFIEYQEIKDLAQMRKEYEIKLKIVDYLIKQLQDLIISYDKMFKLLIISSNRPQLYEIYKDLKNEINQHINLINTEINLLYNEYRNSTRQARTIKEEDQKLNKHKK
jgi:ribosomal protein L16 Arg81 hydroxylase